jgi:hypothetical protein
MNNIFVGFQTEVTGDAFEYVSEIKAPKNYKDPVKIEEYIEKERINRGPRLALCPFTARIFELVVIGDHGQDLWDGASRPNAGISGAFFDFLQRFDEKPTIIGFNIGPLMHIAAMETRTGDNPIPFTKWLSAAFHHDPWIFGDPLSFPEFPVDLPGFMRYLSKRTGRPYELRTARGTAHAALAMYDFFK